MTTPDDGRAPSPAHERFADSTRRLMEAALTARHTDEELDEVADRVDELVARLGGSRLPERPLPRGRTHADYLPRSPFVGSANPVAPPFDAVLSPDGLVARGAFTDVHQGPPGYVHGGWVALAFDEALGMANTASGQPGLTGRLTVRYRRPTPLHREVVLEAHTERVDGRRITTVGTLRADGVVTAEAEGLFVVLGAERALEYFGEHPATLEPTDPLP